MTNESLAKGSFEDVSRLLGVIGQSSRIQILLVISEQEACVCHLEAVLGMRQASISQHLMTLRKAGLVYPIREGRNIFYRLASPQTTALIHQAARLAGIPDAWLAKLARRPVDGCPCPQCNPDSDPQLSCSNPSRKVK